MRYHFKIFWTVEDVEHIESHGVQPWEVGEVLAGDFYARFKRRYDKRSLEKREFWDILGETRSGRVLFISIEFMPDGMERVSIARDAAEKEKSLYRRMIKQ